MEEKTRDKDNFVYVDVDFTLIVPSDVDLLVPDSVNHKLVAKIREMHAAGKNIIIWTSNTQGIQHCKDAAKLCGIKDIVYDYLPKPYLIVDDDHLEYYRTIDPLTLEVKESRN